MAEALADLRPGPAAPPAPRAGVALVGRPNVGKSALFGALTRSYATVSNYPGTTVEVARGRAAIGGATLPVLDTPGAHSLIPSSEEERVTRDILLDGGAATVVGVGDAKDLSRTLVLALQVVETGLPSVLCLNMADEAAARGVHVDAVALSGLLGIEVLETVAVERRGVAQLCQALGRARVGRARVPYPEALERAIAEIAPLLPEAPIAARSLALSVLAGDETLVPWLRARLAAPALGRIEDVRQRLRRRFRQPVRWVVARARLAAAETLAARVASRDPGRPARGRATAAWLERASVHPLWSWPLLGVVLCAAWLFVGVLGAGTLVGLLEDGLFGRFINPAAVTLVERLGPWPWVRDLLVGPYGVLTMALTYALALILPIVGTFFVAFGILEDSGYLPRLAVVLDRVFKKMGLNGKAVLPMVLGLGCDTMATLTTRILDTRKERLIAIVLLTLGVPCSAQLAVIVVMLGAISPLALVVWAAVLAGVIVLVGTLAARVIPGRRGDFVVELPPMRLPRPSNVLLKTVARIEWYLKEAVPLFVVGTLVLFVADRLRLLEGARRLAEPIVTGWLGLPRETAEAFIVGFLRRDFGAAGLYRMQEAGALDPAQVLVAAVTITLFVPCIAQFLMTVRERGWRTGLAIAAFVFAIALGTGGLLSRLLGATGWMS